MTRLARALWIMIGTIVVLVMAPAGLFLYSDITGTNFMDERLMNALIVGICVFSFLVVPGFFLLRWLRALKIKNTGLEARATVERAEPTGVTINDRPVYELHLTVHPPYDQAFSAVIDYCAPMPGDAIPEPGSRITVFWLEGTTEVVLPDE